MNNSIEIIYEDPNILVINKPAGLVVHSDGRTDEPTVVDWILTHRPKIKGVGEQIQDSRLPKPELGDGGQARFKIQESPNAERSGIVHRLDRDTSGVMVIAKNQKAFEFLKKQFQAREMEKTYRAFVYGEMKQDEGVIDRPIARSRRDFRLWSAQRGSRGGEREAVTEYKVLARRDGFSFLDVHPKTGRTHQIRVHLKAINHPVVCDKLYAPKRDCALGFNRLALHAFSIKLKLLNGKTLEISAPYPEDFQKVLKGWNVEL